MQTLASSMTTSERPIHPVEESLHPHQRNDIEENLNKKSPPSCPACMVWKVFPVLTEDECQAIRDDATAQGIQHKISKSDIRHRNSRAHHFRDETLSEILWQRLHQAEGLPSTMSFESTHLETPPLGFTAESVPHLLGEWTAYRVNPQFTLLCYPASLLPSWERPLWAPPRRPQSVGRTPAISLDGLH